MFSCDAKVMLLMSNSSDDTIALNNFLSTLSFESCIGVSLLTMILVFGYLCLMCLMHLIRSLAAD